MLIPILSRNLDERFLTHRLRSTSLAGVVGGLTAIGLFAWQYYGHGIWRWDLFAVAATMAVVKVSAMLWFRATD
jgi:hypothetical protein